jgi:ubiquinol-cytochrome c reductase cytochrome c subunit
VTTAARISARRRHPMATAVVLFLGLVFTGGLYAVLTSTGAASAASTDATPQQIDQGKQIFLEGCSSCHGLNAQGIDSVAPPLVGVGAAAVDFQVGTGRMPLAQNGPQAKAKPVQYNQEQIDALAAYVASLAPGPPIPSADQYNTAGANLQEGGELFRTNCAQCHNFAGKGGALTQGKAAPSLAGADAKMLWEAMVTGPGQMPVFPDTVFNESQKQDIIKFVQTVQHQPNPGGLALGRVGPVSEGLFLFVFGLSAVTAVAVWIGVKSS